MDWTWYELMRSNALGVHWSVGALGVAIVICGTFTAGWWLVGALLRAWGLAPPEKKGPPMAPPAPDPRTERIHAAGLPPSRAFGVMTPPVADMGAILGSGTPSLGPAPPSIGFEPEDNVIRVEEEALPPGLRSPGLGEE